jgi:hypothetical protein
MALHQTEDIGADVSHKDRHEDARDDFIPEIEGRDKAIEMRRAKELTPTTEEERQQGKDDLPQCDPAKEGNLFPCLWLPIEQGCERLHLVIQRPTHNWSQYVRRLEGDRLATA